MATGASLVSPTRSRVMVMAVSAAILLRTYGHGKTYTPAAALVRGLAFQLVVWRGGRRVGFNANMARGWNSFPQIESLQIDLLRLAFNIGSAEKDLAVDAVRCVLLSHVAALEAAGAILQSLTSSPALISSLSVDALEALEEATETIPRQKPD